LFDFKNMKKTENNHKEQCQCQTTQGLFVGNRQVSIVIAGLLLLSFFLFMGGYFWGQKNATTAFSNRIDQESFGDQIYSSMCSLCDSGDVEEDGSESEEHNENDTALEASMQEPEVEPASQMEPLKNEQVAQALTTNSSDSQGVVHSDNQGEGVCSESTSGEDELSTAQYFAQLAGFGTVRAAQQFASRLARKEIAVVVKKRQSRSARGRFVSWYQVITEKFDDKGELESLVSRLAQEEKLKDVQIVTC